MCLLEKQRNEMHEVFSNEMGEFRKNLRKVGI
jgi:hypothetical protein